MVFLKDGFKKNEYYRKRIVVLFICFVALRPSHKLWSWQDGQFTLPHFFLDKLEHAVNQYSVHILLLVTDKLTTALLE